MEKPKIDFKAVQRMFELRKKEGKRDLKSGTQERRWVKLPPEGSMKIRFLPPIGNELIPGKVVFKHYNLPHHERLKGNITCFKTYNLSCPLCAVLESFSRRLDKKQLEEFSGSSAFFNVLVLDDQKYNPQLPYILQTSEYTYDWLLQVILNQEVGDITDIENGASVLFKRKSMKGAFERLISRTSKPICDDPEMIEEILSQMYDLNSIWRQPDDNYLNIANELAEALEDVIETRLIHLSDKKEDAVREVVEAKRRTVVERDEEETLPNIFKNALEKETGRSANRKPKGVPECFGKHEEIRKCYKCAAEYDCREASE